MISAEGKCGLIALSNFLPSDSISENLATDVWARKFSYSEFRSEMGLKVPEMDSVVASTLNELIRLGYVEIYMNYVSIEGSEIYFTITDNGIMKAYRLIAKLKANALYGKAGDTSEKDDQE